MMAEVYYTANDLTNAIAAYKSIGIDSLNDKELMQYSLSLYIKKDYTQSLDTCHIGHKRASKDPVFNRLLPVQQSPNCNISILLSVMLTTCSTIARILNLNTKTIYTMVMR